MRYFYSVIRFVPDAVRGEFVNIGALAGSDESGEWRLRLVDDMRRARYIDESGSLPGVINHLENLKARMEGEPPSGLGGQVHFSGEWLANFTERSQSLLQFTDPAPIMADSLEEVLEIAFDEFIIDPGTDAKDGRSQSKRLAKSRVRQSYERVGLKINVDFLDDSVVRGRDHHEKFDFVVMNGRAVQLTQAWSFQLKGLERLVENIKAWAWTVQDIRRHGGAAKNGQEETIAVPPDVDVESAYVPPASGRTDQQKALEEALQAFEEIDVRPVTFGETEGISERAVRLVRYSQPGLGV